MKSADRSNGAIALVVGGIASAFALSACCALPILLVGAGLSPYWLAPFATVGSQFSVPLTILAVACLAGSAFIVFRSVRTCEPGDLCARPWFRMSIALAAALGTVLLIVSKLYD